MRWLAAPDVMESPDTDVLELVNLVLVAKWAGIAPWELAEMPVAWFDAIRLARDVEISRMNAADKPAGR